MRNIFTVSRFKFTIISLLIVCSSALFAQTLTFRVNNPKLVRISSIDRLEFDIEIKSSQELYVDAVQSNFFFNLSGLQSTGYSVVTTGISAAIDIDDNAMYAVDINTNGSKINVYVYSNHTWASGDNLSDYYAPVYTDWTTLVKVRMRVLSNTEVAGVYFDPSVMGNAINQTYVNDGGQFNQWSSIALDETKYLRYLYLGRVFANSLWSQAGGTLDWTSFVNTSIWDGSPVTTSGTNYNMGALRVHNTASFVINPGANVTANGDIDIIDDLALKVVSDASGSGSLIPNGAVSGTAEVQQYLTVDAYHEISSPISDGLSGVFDNPNGSEVFVWLYRFQENEGIFYTIQGINVPLNVGQGYSAFADGNLLGTYDHALVSFSGQLNLNDVSLNLSYTDPNSVPAAKGFNLVGNPYQSALLADIHTWPKSNLDNAVWVKQSTSGNYYFWNGENGNLPPNGEPALLGGVIPAKQGFWVKANDINPSLTIRKASRTHSAIGFYKDALINNLRIHVIGVNEKSDDAIIWFNASADVLKDHILDVDKFYGDEDAPQLYFPVGSSQLSLNALPSIEQSYMVPMNFKCGVTGTYTITVSDIGSFDSETPILLEDLKTNQVIDLRNSATYSFDYTVGEPETRFRVFFKDAAGIGDNESGIVLSTYGKEIIINNTTGKSGQVFVYTMLGQLIKQAQFNSNGQTQINGIQQNGNFVVKVVSGNVNFTQKVYLN